jgi:putative ABC transport system permease protein
MFWRKRKSNDFDSEIQSHLELEIDHLKQQGLSEEDARSEARRRFGNVTRAEEQFYESQRWAWADTLWRNIRFGLRSLFRSPGFTCTAILVIALGLGGNIAIFAVIRSFLLKPLPFDEPSQLIVLYQGQQKDHEVNLPIDAGSFGEWRRAMNNSAELALVAPTGQYGLSIRRGELPEMIDAGYVSWNFFHLLGVEPALGRTFSQPQRPSHGHPNGFSLAPSL